MHICQLSTATKNNISIYLAWFWLKRAILFFYIVVKGHVFFKKQDLVSIFLLTLSFSGARLRELPLHKSWARSPYRRAMWPFIPKGFVLRRIHNLWYFIPLIHIPLCAKRFDNSSINILELQNYYTTAPLNFMCLQTIYLYKL